jgi:hypothetical protein
MSPLRWTCKSTHKLAAELRQQGHAVSHETVRQLLLGLDYCLQATRKTREGSTHPDRDEQFAHRNAQIEAFQAAGQPVIRVDTKKKELVGDFANSGREWRPSGQPEAGRVHDFVDQELDPVTASRELRWMLLGFRGASLVPGPSERHGAPGHWPRRETWRERLCVY